MRKPQSLVGSRVSMELFHAKDTLSPTWCQISMSVLSRFCTREAPCKPLGDRRSFPRIIRAHRVSGSVFKIKGLELSACRVGM